MTPHQADGVFQGGGVKRIALAGALEEFADGTRHPQNYVQDQIHLPAIIQNIKTIKLTTGRQPAVAMCA
jgi:hypothetical protein